MCLFEWLCHRHMIPRWPLVTSVLPRGEEDYFVSIFDLMWKKKQCGNKPDRLLGATASVSICFLQNIYHNQTMMLPVQPGATLAHMLFIPPRPGSCLLCLLVHPGSKSGTVLVREPQVKTVCNHTKSIYEYYSCSAVSTIATLGYSL